ncbi:NLR family CARD domain-containing protein 3-like [Astyanax mexicanus]|uniref:NLR family CARD domain-containing protein 3-like n=1 Tax=Astyanax mexicanus TaxID=7994 RepID=UPI0020CAD53C|nr:NLR family CARD domain-containing protein 3-like [Astyanax mexicanus]
MEKSGGEKRKRAESPASSEWSMDSSPEFSGGGGSSGKETLKSGSTAPSCVSMKSDWSINSPPNFSSESGNFNPQIKKLKSESPTASCVSMKSDWSINSPPNFNSESVSSDTKKKTNICRKMLDIIFMELQHKCYSLVNNGLNTFKNILTTDLPACSESEVKDGDDQRELLLKITLLILRNMKETDLANTLESKLAPACHQKLKSKLRDKYQRINEGILGHEKSALLNDIYTELYITEGGSGEVNQEHEVKQIEAASRKSSTQETPIKCNDIFKPLPEQKRPIRTVLTKGVAGIGKTVSVQKFILDWSEGEVNQDVLFIFPLPFRELNLMKEKQLSLVNLLQRFFPETQDLKPRHYKSYKIMFIFDGLDECRLPLDFQNNENLVDLEEPTSVDVLLTNLIKGNLLPSALLWITSRPAAVSQIPPECVDQVTEVRGFSDPQKQEYFMKRIRNQDLANKVFAHIRSSRSLCIMCHIPVFCWITATVLEKMLSEAEGGEIPKTLTQMFTHFLIFQIKHKSQKYSGKSDTDPQQTRESVLALGKLAFQQLKKGNLIFYEEDLIESGIDIRDVSVYSGVCTQIFREEHDLNLGKVFSFVHLSVQEFLAALYAFLCFIERNVQITKQKTSEVSKFSLRPTMTDLLNSAVDKALQSESGHLDLFIRFLLGLSLESNQTLLRGILTQKERISYSNAETVKYIKKKIEENSAPEKSINLFHCLNELGDHSLVQEVQKYLSRGDDRHLHQARLHPSQWSALAFLLVNSEEELDEFNLWKYHPSEMCLLRMLPVIKISRRAILSSCNLRGHISKSLGSVLKQKNCLIELDLSKNDLQDSGVELLFDGLTSSHCKLQILRLSSCNLGGQMCKSLGSVLKLKNYLIELDLSNNDLQDSGVELLSAGLKSSHCKLQILRLALCNLGEKMCKTLASVLKWENSSLVELDLSNNDLQDLGVEHLSTGLKSSHCKLEKLRLSGCMVTEKGCSSLASALKLPKSHLKELNLTYNHPGNSREKLDCSNYKLCMEYGGKIRLKPGLKKYACHLSLDPDTAHPWLSLSEGDRKVLFLRERQSCPDNPERFNIHAQVMCRERLSGRCYWEADWRVWVAISVTYEGILRKGKTEYFGSNEKSWTLICTDHRCIARHITDTEIRPLPSKRIGVYLDHEAGILSFYSVSSRTLRHLHTFHTTFTEPVYAGFGFLEWDVDCSARFCEKE